MAQYKKVKVNIQSLLGGKQTPKCQLSTQYKVS